MRILGFGAYGAQLYPRVGMLLEGLRERGFAVQEVDEPLGVGTAQGVKSLTSPASTLRFAAAIAGKWVWLIRHTPAYRGENRPDAVLVGYLEHFDVVLARVLFLRVPIMLDHLIFVSDAAKGRGLSGGGVVGRLTYRLLEGIDRAAPAAADIIVFGTDDHRTLLPARARGRGAVIPVGAPKRWFDVGDRAWRVRDEARQTEGEAPTPVGNVRAPESKTRKTSNREDDGPLLVVFFGPFTSLQGAPTIARALTILEDHGVRIDTTLAGDGQDVKAVRETLPSGENVRASWIDWVNSEDLPDVVAGHDVCLGIFGTSGKAHHVMPNKVYQGIAADCVIVTSDTPLQRRILGGGARFVKPDDAPALADVLQTLARERPWDRGRSCARRCPEGEVSRGQFGGDGVGRSVDGAGPSVDSAGHLENVRVPANRAEPALNQTEPTSDELETTEIREDFRAVRMTDSLARAVLGMGRRRLRGKRERLGPKRVSAKRKRGIPELKRMWGQRPTRGNGDLSSPGEHE